MLVNKKTDWESFRMKIEERIQLTVPLQTEEQLEFVIRLPSAQSDSIHGEGMQFFNRRRVHVGGGTKFIYSMGTEGKVAVAQRRPPLLVSIL
jgi:hypothetical protein